MASPKAASTALPLSAYTLNSDTEQQAFIHNALRAEDKYVVFPQKWDFVADRFNKRFSNQIPRILFQYWTTHLQDPVGSLSYQSPIKPSTEAPPPPSSPGRGSRRTKSVNDELIRLMEDPIINENHNGKNAISLATFQGIFP